MTKTFSLAISLNGEYKFTPTVAVEPLVSLDFKNGDYQIAGVSKTLAEVVVEDASWGSWNPAFVVPGAGIVNTLIGSSPRTSNTMGCVLTAAAEASLLNGFVAVVTGSRALDPGTGGDGINYSWVGLALLGLPSQSPYWEMTAADLATGSVIDSDLFMEDYVSASGNTPCALGAFKAAGLFSPSKLAASANGDVAVDSGTPSVGAKNSVALSLYVQGLGIGASATYILERVDFYSLVDYGLADLPGLSA